MALECMKAHDAVMLLCYSQRPWQSFNVGPFYVVGVWQEGVNVL